MFTRQTVRYHMTRAALLAALLTYLAVATANGVSARGDRYDELAHMNTMTQIQVCEAMGGKAVVETSQNWAGRFISRVRCVGGAMDGFDCFNTRYGTDCSFHRFSRDPGSDVVEVGEIAPLEEPVRVPDKGSLDGPVTIAPIGDETSAPPTPEPGDGQVIEPVVSEPVEVVTDGEATPEPTATPGGDAGIDPVVDDVVVIDEPVVSDGDSAPTRDPSEIKPQIDGELIIPTEPIILT